MPDQPQNADPLDLSAIKALEAAATPGPWFHFEGELMIGPLKNGYGPTIADFCFERVRCGHRLAGFTSEAVADSAFCAASRAAVPALVAEVERLREALREVVESEAGWSTALNLPVTVRDRHEQRAVAARRHAASLSAARALLGQPGGVA